MKKLRPAHEVRSNNPRLGQCYSLAGFYVSTHPDCILVHGTIQGLGYPPNPHAWVVWPNGRIFDPVVNGTWDAEEHRIVFNAVEEIRYTYVEMLHWVYATEHWGPWHDEQEEKRA